MAYFFSEDTIKKGLVYAGIYNILWGFLVIVYPNFPFGIMNLPLPNYPEIWQCVGMIVGVYGIGYFIASSDPVVHWPIVLVGFLGKVFGPLGFLKALFYGTLPLKFGFIIVFNDLIWLPLFYSALIYAYKVQNSEQSAPKQFNDLINGTKTNLGENLSELSQNKNVLLIFIRHLGCTFCRETVSEVANLSEEISKKNLIPVFVHMSDPEYADQFFGKYFSKKVSHVSDPQRKLFQSLNLERGSINQVMGPKVWFRGVWAGLVKGHGLGALEGDPLQLGGVFVLSKGQIIFEHKNSNASEVFSINNLPS